MINALKHPSFFRPTSRPSSPAPVQAPTPVSRPENGGIGLERVARPLNKLSGSFRKMSPTPIQAIQQLSATVVQDGSYLEVLALKLSEAVSKALAQPTAVAVTADQLAGKRPIPPGRGKVLGTFIASELKATRDNVHLHRAILRSLHRPLSVLLTNLSAQLVPLISSAAFHTPTAPTIQAPNPNPTQLHALSIATFAGELLDTAFDDLGLGLDADIRGDGLKIIREGLVSLVNRVVNPLINGIKNELTPLISALETPNSVALKVQTGLKSSAIQHPSIVTLQAIMPVYARALTRYTTTPTSQNNLATFLISLLWRALMALSNRHGSVLSNPPSPALMAGQTKKRKVSPSNSPPSVIFNIKLPPSRPPSPPLVPVLASVSSDARALYELLNLSPRPAKDKETTRVAREAVDEAYDDMQILPALLDLVERSPSPNNDDILSQLELLTEELPTLVALPILLRTFGPGTNRSTADAGFTVAALLNLSEEEYRKACLSGFGRAEECATTVGQRVLDALTACSPGIVIKWLEREISEDQH